MIWLLLTLRVASADIAPPTPMDPCSPSMACPKGEGIWCKAWSGEADVCKGWATKGLTFACKKGDDRLWTELWCGDTRNIGDASVPPPLPEAPGPKAEPARKEAGCNHAGFVGAGAALLGLLGVRARRRA